MHQIMNLETKLVHFDLLLMTDKYRNWLTTEHIEIGIKIQKFLVSNPEQKIKIYKCKLPCMEERAEPE